MRRAFAATLLVSTWLAAPLAACDDGSDPAALDDGAAVDPDLGKPLLGTELRPAKSDSFDGMSGPADDGLIAASEVWEVERRWYHVTGEAGIAWEADSGLTWDEKYAAWVASLEQQASSGWGETFELVTPWGTALPAPQLECAEAAMFLRAAFASWYGLPFYLSALHPQHGRIFFGHFGVVGRDGAPVPGYPRFSQAYADHRPAEGFDAPDAWPRDETLRGRSLTSLRDDANPFLGDDAYAGAYFDEVFLNKRTGWLLLHLLTNLGSMHLADSYWNTFNLDPGGVRAGDVLLQRWQRQGIGHTVVVKEATHGPTGALSLQSVFGSMPRIQPRWYGPEQSRSYFTSTESGGPGANGDDQPYAALGGGLKRWRTPVVKGGRWYNIVPVRDRELHVSASDLEAIAARPAQFAQLLGALTPEEERDVLRQDIASARENLSLRPASCANRTRREEAFDALYALNEAEFGMSREETDRAERTLADYVFAELVYEESRTCCWNRSTEAMYELVMAFNAGWIHDAETGTCNEPVVFKAVDGDYAVFREYAESVGQGEAWVAWSDDEPCPQAVAGNDDVEAEHAWTPLCEVSDSVTGTPSNEPPEEDDEEEDPCGGIDWEGECQGATVVWCDDDTLHRYECDDDRVCAWDEEADYYWCLPAE